MRALGGTRCVRALTQVLCDTAMLPRIGSRVRFAPRRRQSAAPAATVASAASVALVASRRQPLPPLSLSFSSSLHALQHDPLPNASGAVVVLVCRRTRISAFGAGAAAATAALRRCAHATRAKSAISAPPVAEPGAASDTDTAALTPFVLADIGEGIAEVELVRWLVDEGDRVQQFDPIAEVQSDKATVEITCRFDGVLRKIPYAAGDIVKVGDPLCYIDTASASAAHGSARDSTGTERTSPAADGDVGGSGDGSDDGDGVRNAPDDRVARGAKPLATPAVRRVAREHNVELGTVTPSGEHGRILKADVLALVHAGTGAGARRPDEYCAEPEPPHAPAAAAAPSLSRVPASLLERSGAWTRTHQQRDFPVFSEVVHTEPVRGLRRAMVKSMTAAAAVPHLGYGEEAEVNSLVALREQLAPQARRAHDVKLSYMPFLIKAASLALNSFPILNASLDDQRKCANVRYHKDHNVSVAIDTPRGLIVPNIKSVQERTVIEIALELKRLQRLAHEGGLGENDLGGGTFALSNIGSIGGVHTSPVIMVPQVAIGAIGRIRREPRFVDERAAAAAAAAHGDGDMRIRLAHIMSVTFAADHRIIDGATIANFCSEWKRFVESPAQMLVELK